jgi:hypothetical protein
VEQPKLRVGQWTIKVPLAGDTVPTFILCSGYDPEVIPGVIQTLTRNGYMGPSAILVEIYREQ